jgi:rubrerythrin
VFLARLSQRRRDAVLVGPKFYDAAMSARYVCDYCGHQGEHADDEPVDSVQCPMCGEPVTPLD